MSKCFSRLRGKGSAVTPDGQWSLAGRSSKMTSLSLLVGNVNTNRYINLTYRQTILKSDRSKHIFIILSLEWPETKHIDWSNLTNGQWQLATYEVVTWILEEKVLRFLHRPGSELKLALKYLLWAADATGKQEAKTSLPEFSFNLWTYNSHPNRKGSRFLCPGADFPNRFFMWTP